MTASSHRSPALAIRLAIFWSWIATLLLGLVIYVGFGRYYHAQPGFTVDCLTKFVGFLLPQLGIMGVFFFQLKKDEQARVPVNEPALTLAAWLSAIYNAVFCLLLILGVGFMWLGEDWSVATDLLLKIMGLFAFFSTSSITYLFTTRHDHVPAEPSA